MLTGHCFVEPVPLFSHRMMSSYTEMLPGGSLVLTCMIFSIFSVVLSIGPVVSNRGAIHVLYVVSSSVMT